MVKDSKKENTSAVGKSQAVRKSPLQEKKKTPAMVYVGPNSPTEPLLKQYTVFRDGLPEHIQAQAKANPTLAGLFVPVEKLNSARAELKRVGSNASRRYQAMLQMYRSTK